MKKGKIAAYAGVVVLIGGVITNSKTMISTAKDVIAWLHPEPTPPILPIPFMTSPPPSPTITNFVGPIQVIGTKTTDRPDGMYFHFNANDLDVALGNHDWHHKMFLIKRARDQRSGYARIWRGAGGPVGTARGRYNDNPKAGDWRDGDSFFIYPDAGRPFRDE